MMDADVVGRERELVGRGALFSSLVKAPSLTLLSELARVPVLDDKALRSLDGVALSRGDEGSVVNPPRAITQGCLESKGPW